MTTKKLTYLLIFLLISLSIGLAYRYRLNQQENVALALKLRLLEADKKSPVTWNKLLAAAADESDLQARPETRASELPEPAEIERDSAPDINLSEQATDLLAKQTELSLNNRERLSLADVNRAIEIADELIEREPDSYSAYKAKLILILTRESAHLVDASDDDIEDLLEEMASFDITSTVALRKEAFLVARTNTRIDALDADIDDAEAELADVEFDLDFAEEDSDEENLLLTEADALDKKIADQIAEIERLEAELEADLLANEINEDIIEIPLQRGLARGTYEEVIDESEALLEEFGESVVAYYYLIRALDLNGDEAAALDLIADSDLSESDRLDLERRLRRSRREDPKDYWKRLQF